MAPTGKKAWLEIEATAGMFPCLFNPTELAITKGNRWDPGEVPGKAVPDLFYNGGESGTLALNLVFDTTDTGKAVTGYTNKLLDAMAVNPNLQGHDPNRNKGRPPWVKFHWGHLHSWKTVIVQLSLNFTYFSSSGMPLRAKAALSLKQYAEDGAFWPQNPTSGTPEPHRVHQFGQGETLHTLAARYYGDPTQWRVIAEANRIDDPLGVEPGSLLLVPTAPPDIVGGGRRVPTPAAAARQNGERRG